MVFGATGVMFAVHRATFEAVCKSSTAFLGISQTAAGPGSQLGVALEELTADIVSCNDAHIRSTLQSWKATRFGSPRKVSILVLDNSSACSNSNSNSSNSSVSSNSGSSSDSSSSLGFPRALK